LFTVIQDKINCNLYFLNDADFGSGTVNEILIVNNIFYVTR